MSERPFHAFFASFWTSRIGRAVRRDPDAQRAAVYLITAPGANVLGLYYLAVPTLAHEVGLDVDAARAALGRLEKLGFCRYDEAAEVVWVVEAARFQLLETGKRRLDAIPAEDHRVAWLQRLFDALPSSALRAPFLERYGAALHLDEGAQEGPSEGPSQAPSQAPPGPLGGTEQELNKNKKGKRTRASRRSASLPLVESTAPEGAMNGSAAETPDDLLAAWNEHADDLPKALALSPVRRKHAAARLRERPLGEWVRIIRRVAATPFLRGENDRGWRANFDWLIRSPESALKVVEGFYGRSDDDAVPQGDSYDPEEVLRTLPAAIEVPAGTPDAREIQGAWILEVQPDDPRHPFRRQGRPETQP